MKSLALIDFFLITEVYSKQAKIQDTSKTVENSADSIDCYFLYPKKSSNFLLLNP